MQYLIDTNIVIYYFNGLTNDGRIGEHLYQKAQAFISHANVFGLVQSVVDKTIVLRQHHKIKMPDAIIAATALVHGFGIATNNIDDFKRLGIEALVINVL
ncbi:type II toxin-antitoxin system VapC family toxin [Crenothrix sp.]|uniref:type II toxin-antitoxin system VapC family toxin n=1 Tax=Crenothrix sp. TaxID=3100433 RepID=UPI00374D27FE